MGPSDNQAPDGARPDPLEVVAARARPGQARRSQSGQEEQQIALRKARLFASRGQDHLAEVQINLALVLGSSLQDVDQALEDIGPRQQTFTRREAIKRAVALLGAGLLSGSVIDALAAGGPALAAGSRAPTGPTGVFLTLPPESTSSADGSYQVAMLGAGGVGATFGAHRGDTIVDGHEAYNVAQWWRDGAASTRVTIITSSGPRASFSLPGAGSSRGASIVESATTATKRGSLLYCCHTWMRIFGGNERQVGPDANVDFRFTAQPVLEVMDVNAHALVDRWIGTEVAGACRPALKVSADGAAAMLALDMPGVPPAVPRVMVFDFDGERLSAVSAVTPTSQTRSGLGSSFYHWPNPGSPLVHVAFDGVHRYTAGHSNDTFCGLPVEYANNRHPPAMQGTFASDGTAVASSGDGRIFWNRPDDATSYTASTFLHQPERPPYLAYQGNSLHQVFQTAGSRTWAVDNREGIGGIWQLSPGFEPIDHILAGSYISNLAVDASGRYLLAQSALDSAIYAIDADGATTAFQASPRTNLVRRS